MIHLAAGPVTVAFYPEMVVAFDCERTPPRIGLQQSLRKCYTGRNTVFFHLVYSQIAVSGYVIGESIL